MKCPKCGNENKEGANFCANCRHDFNKSNKIDRESPAIKNRDLTIKNKDLTVKENPTNDSSKLPIVACLAIIIIAILMVAVIANGNNIWSPNNSTDEKIPVDNHKNLKIPQNNKIASNNSSNSDNAEIIDEYNSIDDDSNVVSVEENQQEADEGLQVDNQSVETNITGGDAFENSVNQNIPPVKHSTKIDFQDLTFKLTKDSIFDIGGKCTINNDGQYSMVIKLLDQNQNQLSDLLLVWDTSSVNYEIGEVFDLNHYAYGDDLTNNKNTVFVDVYIFDRFIQASGDDVEENLDLSEAIYYERVVVS